MAGAMSYIDENYYLTVFGGEVIPAADLPRYLRYASDVIDMIVYRPIAEVTDLVKKAICYEAEMLYLQGGEDALAGLSVSGNGISEQLGDYHVTRGSGYAQMINSEKHPLFINGVPISPIAVNLLRRVKLADNQGARPSHAPGYMSRLVKNKER